MTSKSYTYNEYKPISLLENYIDCFWTFDYLKDSPQSYSILPDSCFDLVLAVNKRELVSSRVTGVWENKIDLSYNKPTKLLGVRFKLGAIYRLIEYPIKDILNGSKLIDLNDLGLPLEYIEETLFNNPSLVIKVLESHFINILDIKKSYKSSDILNYFDLLHGCESIETIAGNIGVSTRQLRRVFNDVVGLSPKRILKIVRFRQYMDNSNNYYYDQSHLYRDIKGLCNLKPRDLKTQNSCPIYTIPNV